jgi:ferredoxin like protein
VKIDEKVALNAFNLDTEPHITLDEEKCGECEARSCVRFCPAGLYEYNGETGKIDFDFSGCLECGTCRLVCAPGAVSWSHPRGGFGVRYRFG